MVSSTDDIHPSIETNYAFGFWLYCPAAVRDRKIFFKYFRTDIESFKASVHNIFKALFTFFKWPL